MDEDSVKTVGVQRTSLNGRQVNQAKKFLNKLTSVPYCGLNADGGKGCGKTEDRLRQEWMAQQIKRGRNNAKRKKPFLLVNEKKGHGLHRILNGQLEKFGNICYYCFSCNALFDKGKKQDIIPTQDSTYQSKKSHAVRPKFKKELMDYLMKFGDICYLACLNKWSGRDDYNCSQETLRNAFNQMIDVTVVLLPKESYGIDCTYPNCNGDHIFTKDESYRPLPNKSDQQTLDEESQTKPIEE